MTDEQKNREARVRRQARRLGIVVKKLRGQGHAELWGAIDDRNRHLLGPCELHGIEDLLTARDNQRE